MAEGNKVCLLLIASGHCHDNDEWLGIYTDVEKLQRDYERACAEPDVDFGAGSRRYLHVKIEEFELNQY